MLDFSLSVVIPVFNEKDYLLITFEEVYKVVVDNFREYEMIFVDDGSVDESAQILGAFQKKYPSVKVVRNEKNQGLGAALRKGFFSASKECIFYIDCDLPTDPVFVLEAASYLKDSDIIIGERSCRETFLRRFLSFSYDLMISRIFGLEFKNINSGIKIFKRKVLKDISLVSSSPFLNAELLIEAKKKGFRIKEVPCLFKERLYGSSKMCSLENIFSIISEMSRYYFKNRKAVADG